MSVISYLDSYKVSHKWQYPENTEMVYSNWTIRGCRIPGVDSYVYFGIQYYIKEYLIKKWNEEFFNLPKEKALKRFRKVLKNSLGVTDITHYEKLHDLGYLPIEMMSLPEGSQVPLRVPCFTMHNTHPDFYWVTNMLETITSCVIWGMINNAHVGRQYAIIRKKYLSITDSLSNPIEPFLNHNFAYRGIMGNEAAIITDAAWLIFSQGSDTVPTIEFMEDYYNADSDKELISASIPATEHSVACAGGKDGEVETFKRMINLYKNTSKVFSFVCDTWDYFNFISKTLKEQKDFLLESGCKCVLRPDSSPKTPYEIICGDLEAEPGTPEYKGSLEILWDIFGGTYNEKGFRVLHPQIGLIYGEAISPELYEKILNKMVEMKFCVSNLVVGVGSYSQVYNQTRDTFKQAFKATAVQIEGKLVEIFKDPKTDTSGKKSAKGLLMVYLDENGEYALKDQCTWEEVYSEKNQLKPIFKDGVLLKEVSLAEIRERAKIALEKDLIKEKHLETV
jgi:nicotinamide phosphoribosyltransferase